MSTLSLRILVVLLLAGATIGAMKAIPPDPCPYSGAPYNVYYFRTATACYDDADSCVWYSPNYGYTETCYVWCCYDYAGNFMGKRINGCSDCELNGGCCNNLMTCIEAVTNAFNGVHCPIAGP